ncbi:5-formyltetrahydrofolate cyclo-ligase [Serratia microhaemolytica]|uniref:5-formyltetrahydrofolate cyclo-ligase n=1 Tax=Serratia microhaemolytica TaxID=2675110 RepID=UPI000FDEC1E4|nr:5-formyltetrahydrofolate cyclo-ligase [Serratia microhaemolytica]
MPFQPQFAQQRHAIRQQIRQRRRALTAAQQQQFADQIALSLLQHSRVQFSEKIAVFLSFDGELETATLIQRLWQSGKRLYLPVLHPFSAGHLLFLAYTPHTRLVYNRFNILEPALDVANVLPFPQLELLLTPLVAFDLHGHRLGMGGGFYDRTLQHWQAGGPYPIGLAHDCQQVERLPVEAWDVPLPEIITPTRNWRW